MVGSEGGVIVAVGWMDRDVIIWGGERRGVSFCLLPLLIGTSASETATDAEAQRERWRAMVVVRVDVSCQVADWRFTTSQLTTATFHYHHIAKESKEKKCAFSSYSSDLEMNTQLI